MRSNYWSSDVCSSDLYTRQHPEISQDLRAPPAPDFEGDFRVLTGIFGDHALQEGDGIVVREADAQHAGDLGAVEMGSDRKSVVEGKSAIARVSLGGSRIIDKKHINLKYVLILI